MGKNLEQFNEYRSRMNEKILAEVNLIIKRLFNLDMQTCQEGALSIKIKEMLGLVASLVLRCDDCVKYHLIRCHEQGVTRKELFEITAVGNIVGGTIIIPHALRAVQFGEELEAISQPTGE